MNIMEQLELMDKLSPFADEIIENYNKGNEQFEVSNINIFEKHGNIILEIVGGAGIKAKYEKGKVFINFETQ